MRHDCVIREFLDIWSDSDTDPWRDTVIDVTKWL